MLRLHTLSVAALALVGSILGCTPSPSAPATRVGFVVRAITADIPVGRLQRLSAEVSYSDGTSMLVTGQAEWSSESPEIADLDRAALPGSVRALQEGAAVIVARFDGDEARLTVKATPHALEGLRIEADASGALPKGASRQLRAIGVYSDGASGDVTDEVTWTASSEAVALDTAAPGLVLGASEGTADVVAALEGVEARASVQVTAATVARLEVDPPVLGLADGTTKAVTATAVFTDGTTADVTADADWSSSDPAVLTFDGGHVRARAPGAVELHASWSGAKAMVPVTVTPAELTQLLLSPGALVLPRGAQSNVVVAGVFSDGTVQDLSAQAMWATTDASIAEVSAFQGLGTVTAKTQGACDVRVSVGAKTAALHVTVTAAQLITLSVALPSTSVAAGNTLQAKAIGTYSDSSTLDLSGQVAWTAAQPAIATVDSDGTVHAVAPGLAAISATFEGQQPSVQFNVTAPTLNALVLTGETATLPKGRAFVLGVQGVYSDGHSEDVGATVAWSSSNPQVASVSNAAATRGTVTGISEGVATLTASVNGLSVSTNVEISAAVVDHVEISPGSASLPVGVAATFTATQVFSDGARVSLGALAAWSSSSPNVATVDASGTVTAVGQGTAVITVTDGSQSASMFVTVTAPVVLGITVSQPQLTLPVGTGAALIATAHWSDGATQDITQAAVWTSSDAGVASVSPGGIVNAVAEGSVILTPEWNGFSVQARVQVTPAAIVSVQLYPAGGVVNVGQSIPVTATATYTDGRTDDVTAAGNWVSTATATATVAQTSSGWAVTGVSPGGAEIRVYLQGFVAGAFFTVQ